MKRVQIGTDGYTYLFVPKLKKVQIGTTPFRGVPFVPWPKTIKLNQFRRQCGGIARTLWLPKMLMLLGVMPPQEVNPEGQQLRRNSITKKKL